MAGCNTETWTLEDLSSALQSKHKDNKRIVVPMFQRGLRWKKDQKRTFIDSLEKGYPVGTMLFYEQIEYSTRTYILVDGLQRSNCIREYINSPGKYLPASSISDPICDRILTAIHRQEQQDDRNSIRRIVLEFINERQTYKNLQYFIVAERIIKFFNCGYDTANALIDIFTDLFSELQDRYDAIANTRIPVIVYTGSAEHLPEIFDRINSKGTPLDQYEVYAASWPVEKKFKIANKEIIEHVINKYETFIEDGYLMHGYSKDVLRNSCQVTAFEYLFGLSRYLSKKYSFLGFHQNIAVDAVNPLAFELIDACLNEINRIDVLYNNIYNLDVDLFEMALEKAIAVVEAAISPVMYFKSNNHSKKNKIFHSKFQILSMISTTFKEMYPDGNYTKLADDWENKKVILQRNLLQYYVYDIITNWWAEGGNSKIYNIAKPNKYLNDIPAQSWAVALNGYFEKTLQHLETKNVAAPRSEEYVFLNVIYMNSFTAKDQLSEDKFDIEHIAPKKQMQNLIKACKRTGAGLPISSIANLCYLPEAANRSKGALNFYQDDKYLKHVDLEEVESKYSFTKRDDLEWMDMPYEISDDFDVLKEEYTLFLRNRYVILKQRFCDSLNIVNEDVRAPEHLALGEDPVALTLEDYVKRFAELTGKTLIRIKGNTLKTIDGKEGYFISRSKDYHQGNRSKYWFAYRPIELWKDCERNYYMYGCERPENLLVIPEDIMESFRDNLNTSIDEDGKVTHWHIVIFKDNEGRYKLLLSKPELKEVDITQYLVESGYSDAK